MLFSFILYFLFCLSSDKTYLGVNHFYVEDSIRISDTKKVPSEYLIVKPEKKLTDLLKKQGDSCLNEKNWDQAYQIYSDLLKLYKSEKNDSGLALSYNMLGLISHKLGREEDAESFLRRSLTYQIGELAESNYKILAIIYGLTGRFDHELNCYQSLVDYFKNMDNRDGMAASLNSIGYFYLTHGHFSKAVEYFNQAIKILASDLTDAETFLKGQYLGNIARTYYNWGYYLQALKYHRKAIDLFSSVSSITSDLKINIANQQEGIGLVFTQLDKLDSAVFYLKKSLQIREDANDMLGVGMCFDGLGEICKMTGNYTDAFDYLNKAVIIKDSVFNVRLLGGLGYNQATESKSVSYLKLGQLYLDWNKPALALQSFDSSFYLASLIGYEKGKAEVLLEKGNTFLKMNQTDKAEANYNQALEIFHRIENLPGYAMALEQLGDYYLNTGKTKDAYAAIKKALHIADTTGLEELNASLCLKMARIYSLSEKHDSCYQCLSHCLISFEKAGLNKKIMKTCDELAAYFEKAGNADSASFYYKRVAKLRETIFNQELARSVAVLQADYNFRNNENAMLVMTKEKQIRELHLKRTRLYYLLIMILILILGIMAWFYQEKQIMKTQQKAIELEQHLLRTQMNPHFIFNALQAIHNYFYTSTPEKAGDYLSKFARLMRMILENSRKTVISFSNEIEFLDHYLKLQKLRFEDKFDYHIEVDPQILPDEMKIPPMLVQPFIENSIIHGVVPKEGKGDILIKFSLEKDCILFSIEDNGIGMDKPSEKKRKESTSLATKITMERLQGFKFKRKFRELIHIESLFEPDGTPSGTRISFPIPVF